MHTIKPLLRPLKRKLESILGIPVYLTPPHGLCLCSDILRLAKGVPISTIFDVGANTGQSALHFRRHFRSADIHCFEPSSANFRALRTNTKADRRIFCHSAALSDTCGSSFLDLNASPRMHRISHSPDPAKRQEIIATNTIDNLMEEWSISRIGLLKIDTEGHDMRVITGAQNALAKNQIDFVQAEVGMNTRNTVHTPARGLWKHLETLGYQVFGIYDQQNEWIIDSPLLRRCNIAFVSSRIASTI